MVTKLEKMKWEEFLEKYKNLYNFGIKRCLIKKYDEELIKNLRHIYHGGIPLSILLLHNKFTNGFCYDRTPLVTLGFLEDDFRVINADVDGLRLNPKYIEEYRNGKISEHFPNHCIVERILKSGKSYIYDVAIGMIFEKNLYWKLQNPKITQVYDKEIVLENLYYDLKDSDIEEEKYALPFILPNIENGIDLAHPMYQDALKSEIKILKKEIGYDEICKEIHDDMIAKGFLC